MPVQFSYQLQETIDAINLSVSLRGIGRQQLDVYASELFVKITSTPYLLILDLFDSVDEIKSVATVANEELKLILPKVTSGMWPQILFKAEKEAVLKRRSESMERTQAKEKKVKEERERMKREADRHAVQRQIEAEQAERQAMEQRIEEEKRIFMKEAFEEANTADMSAALDKIEKGDLDEFGDEEELPLSEINCQKSETVPRPDLDNSAPVAEPPKDDDIFPERPELKVTPTGRVNPIDISSELITRNEYQPLPPPRQSSSVVVNFTPKVGNVPAREREDPNTESKTIRNPPKAEASTLEEKSAIWLKEKGDKFYILGDYPSAIQAFTDSILLEPSNYIFYANRSAAHFKAGSASFEYAELPKEKLETQAAFLRACIADCEEGLKIIPENTENIKIVQARFLLRKAASYCLLGDFAQGLKDFQEAQKLSPDDTTIQLDAQKVLEYETSAKNEGNILYKEGKFEEAAKAYTIALTIKPAISSFSNRAACYLQLGNRTQDVVDDCTKGLGLCDETTSTATKSRLFSRRAMAACLMGDHSEAVRDYECALQLSPGDTNLMKDLANAREKLAA